MSDIKMFSTSSDKWTKRYKGGKKFKMEIKDFTFKNKKNEFCSIDSTDLIERIKGSLSKMDKNCSYEMTVFFENFGWRECPKYFTSESKKILLWNIEYNNEDHESLGEIWAVQIIKQPLQFKTGIKPV